ncbi:hypothetical protein EP7_005084 [Isosphaeraceae bacterium EP7]
MDSETFDPATVLQALHDRLARDKEGDAGAANRRLQLVTEGFVDLLRVKTTGSGGAPYYTIRVRPMPDAFVVTLRLDGRTVKWRKSVPVDRFAADALYEIVTGLIESESKRLADFLKTR